MPEIPDLEYNVPILRKQLGGKTIEKVELCNPVVLRLGFEKSLEEILVGHKILDLRRHLHFYVFECDGDFSFLIAPMLAGTLMVSRKAKKTKAVALRITLSDGDILHYTDSVQMGKVYLIPKGAYEMAPGFLPKGVDVLGQEFTLERFEDICKKRRDQVKVFLLDKSALDSLGNAYADEVLFAAKIHPKTFVRSLTGQERANLHRAIVEVLRNAIREVAARKPKTDEKIRDFLQVRGRHKVPCPVCETPIRKAGVRGHDAYFCPRCQPETRKSGIVRWQRADG